MEHLWQDLDEFLTYLRFPKEHQKRIRTTNLFLIQGLKVQPVGFAQNFLDASTGYAVLSTSTSTVKHVSNRWKIYRLRENWNSVEPRAIETSSTWTTS
jgi:hypothetical protein